MPAVPRMRTYSKARKNVHNYSSSSQNSLLFPVTGASTAIDSLLAKNVEKRNSPFKNETKIKTKNKKKTVIGQKLPRLLQNDSFDLTVNTTFENLLEAPDLQPVKYCNISSLHCNHSSDYSLIKEKTYERKVKTNVLSHGKTIKNKKSKKKNLLQLAKKKQKSPELSLTGLDGVQNVSCEISKQATTSGSNISVARKFTPIASTSKIFTTISKSNRNSSLFLPGFRHCMQAQNSPNYASTPLIPRNVQRREDLSLSPITAKKKLNFKSGWKSLFESDKTADNSLPSTSIRDNISNMILINSTSSEKSTMPNTINKYCNLPNIDDGKLYLQNNSITKNDFKFKAVPVVMIDHISAIDRSNLTNKLKNNKRKLLDVIETGDVKKIYSPKVNLTQYSFSKYNTKNVNIIKTPFVDLTRYSFSKYLSNNNKHNSSVQFDTSTHSPKVKSIKPNNQESSNFRMSLRSRSLTKNYETSANTSFRSKSLNSESDTSVSILQNQSKNTKKTALAEVSFKKPNTKTENNKIIENTTNVQGMALRTRSHKLNNVNTNAAPRKTRTLSLRSRLIPIENENSTEKHKGKSKITRTAHKVVHKLRSSSVSVHTINSSIESNFSDSVFETSIEQLVNKKDKSRMKFKSQVVQTDTEINVKKSKDTKKETVNSEKLSSKRIPRTRSNTITLDRNIESNQNSKFKNIRLSHSKEKSILDINQTTDLETNRKSKISNYKLSNSPQDLKLSTEKILQNHLETNGNSERKTDNDSVYISIINDQLRKPISDSSSNTIRRSSRPRRRSVLIDEEIYSDWGEFRRKSPSKTNKVSNTNKDNNKTIYDNKLEASKGEVNKINESAKTQTLSSFTSQIHNSNIDEVHNKLNLSAKSVLINKRRITVNISSNSTLNCNPTPRRRTRSSSLLKINNSKSDTIINISDSSDVSLFSSASTNNLDIIENTINDTSKSENFVSTKKGSNNKTIATKRSEHGKDLHSIELKEKLNHQTTSLHEWEKFSQTNLSIIRIDDVYNVECPQIYASNDDSFNKINGNVKENASENSCFIINDSLTETKTGNIFLKPGKQWLRSLSILRRTNIHDIKLENTINKGRNWRKSVCAVFDQQGILTDTSDNQHNEIFNITKKLPISRIKSLSRRTTHQIVPISASKEASVCRNENSILEKSEPASNKSGYVSTLADESQSILASFDKLSLTTNVEERDETSRQIILKRCGQTTPLPFDDCYSQRLLTRCRKIGEGVYGEVFMYKSLDEQCRVMKIIPIEGNLVVNGEHQKKFEEIISEIIIASELSNLRKNNEFSTNGFNELLKICCVQGKYPQHLLDLWNLYDEDQGSENDSPEIFTDEQLYIVLELANGGEDLEAYRFNNAEQSFAVFNQVVCSLAVAESALQFEHRDMHWGNLLIAPTNETTTSFRLNGRELEIATKGVNVSIIDFTLSRMTYNNCCIFNDLALDPDLFTATGDYQFDIYRLMRQRNQDDWQRFEPYSNILWLDYTLEKMIKQLRYLRINTKTHKTYIRRLTQMRKKIFSCKSATELLNSDAFSQVFLY